MNQTNRTIVVRVLAWFIPVAVLIQAAMTGGTLFAALDLTQVHGDIGMVVLLAAAALTVVAHHSASAVSPDRSASTGVDSQCAFSGRTVQQTPQLPDACCTLAI